jgi:L-lactate dehydrogenase complex protein LldE
MTVQLFIPCYVDQFAPHVAHSLCNLLDDLNISWIYPSSQTCCGQFAFNAGDWPSARRLMRHFFKVFNGANVIICPSASCVLTIRQHYPHLVETPADAVQLRRLQPLVLEFSEWLSSCLPLPFPLHFAGQVFFHQSCSARQLGILPQTESLLGLVSNLQLLKISATYSCCGFGGLFSVKRPDLAQAIGLNYLQAVQATGAEALVSPDVGCLLHLQGLLRAEGLSLPVYHIAELICQSRQSR